MLTRSFVIAVCALLVAHSALAQGPAKTPNVAPEAIKDCVDCPELTVIAPGKFVMGSPVGEAEPRYAPQQLSPHEVTIRKAFALGRTELTIAQFWAFVVGTGYKKASGGCRYLKDGAWVVGPNISWNSPGFDVTDSHPVGCLSIEDARAYVAWLSAKTSKVYRLPSEAEWEYAARAGTQTPAFWSGEWADACTYQNGGDESLSKAVAGKMPIKEITPCDDGFSYSAPVASFKPNGWGLYDVSGNVSEWVDDCFSTDVTKLPTDGSAYKMPTCATATQKGGSWAGNPSLLRSGSRLRSTLAVRGIAFGMRVARDIDN